MLWRACAAAHVARWIGADNPGRSMQLKMLSPRQNLVSYAAAFTFILTMVGVAAVFNDREIVLPEMAAMAVALWAYRDQAWMRQPEKIFWWPSLTALLGFGINFLPLPFVGKLVLVMTGMLLLFGLARYSLAPALATGFLPIVTNATEWSFMVAIVVTALVLMLGVLLFRLRDPAPRAAPVPWRRMVVYALIMLAWMLAISALGYSRWAVIPPVAVVVYESLHMPMYGRKMLGKQVLALTLSAAIGVGLAQIVASWVGAVALSMALVYILLRAMGMRMPAAYAFPLLAYVFPPEGVTWLPVAALGNAAFALGAVLLYRSRALPPMVPKTA